VDTVELQPRWGLSLDVQRDKAHRLGGGFFPLTGAAVGWDFAFFAVDFPLFVFPVTDFSIAAQPRLWYFVNHRKRR
jgi:hypothetical protein